MEENYTFEIDTPEYAEIKDSIIESPLNAAIKGEICFAQCETSKCVTIEGPDDACFFSCAGRFLDIKLILKNLCPHKKLHAGVFLSDRHTHEPLGERFAQIITPGHSDKCQNVDLGSFCFVIPEKHMCLRERTVSVKVVYHYAEGICSGR